MAEREKGWLETILLALVSLFFKRKEKAHKEHEQEKKKIKDDLANQTDDERKRAARRWVRRP